MPLSLGAGVALGSLFVGVSGVSIVAIRAKNGKNPKINCKQVSEETCLARTKILETKITGLGDRFGGKMDMIILMLENNGFNKTKTKI